MLGESEEGRGETAETRKRSPLSDRVGGCGIEHVRCRGLPRGLRPLVWRNVNVQKATAGVKAFQRRAIRGMEYLIIGADNKPIYIFKPGRPPRLPKSGLKKIRFWSITNQDVCVTIKLTSKRCR